MFRNLGASLSLLTLVFVVVVGCDGDDNPVVPPIPVDPTVADSSTVPTRFELPVQLADSSAIDSIRWVLTGSVVDTQVIAPGDSIDLSTFPLADPIAVSGTIFGSSGSTESTSPITLFHAWRVRLTDRDESSLARDYATVYLRSSGSRVEGRFEYTASWADYDFLPSGVNPTQDTINFRQALNAAIFFDIDRNAGTGAVQVRTTHPTLPPLTLNGIGADRRIILGSYGDSLSFRGPSNWQPGVQLPGLVVNDNDSVLEWSVELGRLGNADTLDVLWTATVQPEADPWDFVPNIGGTGYTYPVDGGYVGPNVGD